MNKVTLTIAIVAYNEEANIGHLLNALIKQKLDCATVTQIIVVSDASSDRTDEIVASYAPQVQLVRQEKRSGLNAGQNVVMKMAKGDFLCLLDADTLPSSEHVLERAVSAMIERKADLGSVDIVPIAGGDLIERTLTWSHTFKKSIFRKIRGGDNVYTAFGPARFFSRACYSICTYPDNVPNDAYAYFFCIKNAMSFTYIDTTFVWFRSPSTVSDHSKQGTRFLRGVHAMQKEFGKELVDGEYSIPRKYIFQGLFRELFIHPLYMGIYGFLKAYTKYRGIRGSFNSQWEMATSSKKLIK